jgi:hypothetical protein
MERAIRIHRLYPTKMELIRGHVIWAHNQRYIPGFVQQFAAGRAGSDDYSSLLLTEAPYQSLISYQIFVT